MNESNMKKYSFKNDTSCVNETEDRPIRKVLSRSKYSSAHNEKKTEDVLCGGILGTLPSPKLTKNLVGRRKNQRNHLEKGLGGLKLPPIERVGLQNINLNKKDDGSILNTSPQLSSVGKKPESVASPRNHQSVNRTPLKSLNNALLSPVSKCITIDEFSAHSFGVENFPSKIMNSPFSTVSHLATPNMRASMTSSYYDSNTSTDLDDTYADEENVSIVESVVAVEVDDSKSHILTTNESISSSDISVYIPRYRKQDRKKVDTSFCTDYNGDDISGDDDTEYVESDDDENCSDSTCSDADESTSNFDIVNESFFGKTLSIHADQVDSSFNEKSRKGESEHTLNSSTIDSNKYCSDTESEESADELEMKKNQKSRNETKILQEKIINITSTTASLTISSMKEERSMLIDSSKQINSSSYENNASKITILDGDSESESIDKGTEVSTKQKSSFSGRKKHLDLRGDFDKELSRSTSSSYPKNPRSNEDLLCKLNHNSNIRNDKIKWTLGPKIGVGTFGVVHMGMNTRTGKLMAVKKLSIPSNSTSSPLIKDILEGLQDEIELMKSLDHVNIVRYIGSETDVKKCRIYIFQEWIPGGSVASLLHKFGPFSIRVVKTYLTQILKGLTYLHSCRILHRDIKGGNILVNDDGVVKLADFGASKRVNKDKNNIRDDDFENMNQNMIVKGTPYFMAPEVFEERCGPKADVWSVGGVIVQMLTSHPPWRDMKFSTPLSLFRHIKSTTGPPTYKIRPQRSFDDDNSVDTAISDKCNMLDNLIKLCFSRDPTERPTASHLLKHPFLTEVGRSETECYYHSTPNKHIISSKISDSEDFCKKSVSKEINDAVLDTSPVSDMKHWPEWATSRTK